MQSADEILKPWPKAWMEMPEDEAFGELIWVLARGYGYNRQLVGLVIRRILSSPELLVEEDEAVWQALKVYEQGTAGFPDYLMGLLNHRAGASPTLTFDRKSAKESFFELGV